MSNPASGGVFRLEESILGILHVRWFTYANKPPHGLKRQGYSMKLPLGRTYRLRASTQHMEREPSPVQSCWDRKIASRLDTRHMDCRVCSSLERINRLQAEQLTGMRVTCTALEMHTCTYDKISLRMMRDFASNPKSCEKFMLNSSSMQKGFYVFARR